MPPGEGDFVTKGDMWKAMTSLALTIIFGVTGGFAAVLTVHSAQPHKGAVSEQINMLQFEMLKTGISVNSKHIDKNAEAFFELSNEVSEIKQIVKEIQVRLEAR